jgi:hypothetical protein
MSRSRTSKIAGLPAAIWEELNKRLLDGEKPAEIVSWLNGLPPVQKVLERRFGGQPNPNGFPAGYRLSSYVCHAPARLMRGGRPMPDTNFLGPFG